MTALAKLLRTTAFKLSLAYLLVFTLFAFFLLGYLAFNARRMIDDQARDAIRLELRQATEQFASGGPRRLAVHVARRSRQPGGGLYLLLDPAGNAVAGNLTEVEIRRPLGPGEFRVTYHLADASDEEHRLALINAVELPGGFRLIVGRDLGERGGLRNVFLNAAGGSVILVVVLGVVGGIFVTRRVLGRIDAMTDTTRSIMDGNLHGRLTVTGSNDEFDRLAVNLNAMLDRIEELMTGLREVSDNIAHDLKTPLTRLRNDAEQALRTAESPEEFRRSLDDIIAEADDLIRVFNALLLIARAEAKGEMPASKPFDLAAVARDVTELYEPSAEEAGLAVETAIEGTLTVRGSRELIGQAVANLVDNAIKYGARGNGDGAPRGPVTISARRLDGRVEVVVADRGPGVPEADRSRVLERFVRLETARTRPGFGLGLSLVAAVARMHGGEFRLEDNGPGLRAVLMLPAEDKSAS